VSLSGKKLIGEKTEFKSPFSGDIAVFQSEQLNEHSNPFESVTISAYANIIKQIKKIILE